MKIGIYCGMDAGDVIDRSLPYIAADRGLDHLRRLQIKPIVAIGDFDSLDHLEWLKDITVLKYPIKKDYSDAELALRWAKDQGYDEVDLYGVTGGRLDHFIGVLCLLMKYPEITITIYDRTNKITCLQPGEHMIDVSSYRYFSCFAFKEGHLSLKGCLYPLNDYKLSPYDPLCLSNQGEGKIELSNEAPLLFIQSDLL